MVDQSVTQLLVFRLGDLVCGADLARIQEITATTAATRIPGAPSEVLGLANIRGMLVPVVDGGLALTGTGVDQGGSTIMFLIDGTTIGLAVDEVLDMVRVDAMSLTDGGDLPGLDRRVVMAVGRHDGLVFAVLDVDAVVGPMMPPKKGDS